MDDPITWAVAILSAVFALGTPVYFSFSALYGTKAKK
jgi:hypothetical protein